LGHLAAQDDLLESNSLHPKPSSPSVAESRPRIAVPLDDRLEGLERLDEARGRLRTFEKSRSRLRVACGFGIVAGIAGLAHEVRVGEIDGSLAVLSALIAIPVLLTIVLPDLLSAIPSPRYRGSRRESGLSQKSPGSAPSQAALTRLE
jgi:hypothetical protein